MPAHGAIFAAAAARVALGLATDGAQIRAETVVSCDAAAADRLFACWNGYVPRGESAPGRGESRSRCERQIMECPGELRAPTVFLSRAKSTRPRLRFMDGRHLFCVLRDAGAATINLGMPHEHAAAAKTLGLCSKDHSDEQ